jgi:hypothetical protein
MLARASKRATVMTPNASASAVRAQTNPFSFTRFRKRTRVGLQAGVRLILQHSKQELRHEGFHCIGKLQYIHRRIRNGSMMDYLTS